MNLSIVLIGMTASGKTTIGRQIARVAGLAFTDVDQEIENFCGISIPEIFNQHGEETFRLLEKEMTKILLNQKNNQVISTGGGAFMNEQIRAAIRKQGISVWLEENNPEKLIHRMKQSQITRPILQQANPTQRIENLLVIRTPLYKEANIKLMCNEKTPRQLALEAWNAVKISQNQDQEN